MLEHYFRQAFAQRIRTGPLGRYLHSFSATLSEAGYARETGRIQLRLLGHLGDWMRRSGRSVADLDHGAVGAFLVTYRRRLRLKPGDRSTLRRFVSHLHRLGAVAVRSVPTPDAGPLLELERRYESCLRNERGVAAATVERYVWWTHRFLVYRFEDGPPAPSALSASDVASFLINQVHPKGTRRVQSAATALRSFLRFLFREGETEVDLAASVPTAPLRRATSVPKYILQSEVEQLLSGCDRGSSVGRRDYAALLLMARLGLRAGEVAGLRLEDFDWRSGEILVRGKGQVLDRLPLLPEVGAALAAYLRRGRPRSSSRQVFLRAKAPRRGFAHGKPVGLIVRRALARAGLKPPCRGAHLLRHSLATSLLRNGATLGEVADVLRHHSRGTTETYAKVDHRSLRALAPPWPAMAAPGR